MQRVLIKAANCKQLLFHAYFASPRSLQPQIKASSACGHSKIDTTR